MNKHLRALLVGFTFVASLFAFAGLAGAQGNSSTTYVGPDSGPKNEVLSTSAVAPAAAAAPSGVQAAAATTPSAQALAFTGSDSLPLVIAGGTVLLIGAGLLVARRRMSHA
ncbi:MAG: LPXTG cell wall anchor domain-containing protein [Actinobacteria bacterium]|nr:LPXTG cell wall anchor domain-containing protein [Actinomycetota bacterium]